MISSRTNRLENGAACPTPLRIRAYLSERLDPATESAVAAHLEECACCRELREELCTDRELERFRIAPFALDSFAPEWESQLQRLCRRLRGMPAPFTAEAGGLE